jgi:hypothetical protein
MLWPKDSCYQAHRPRRLLNQKRAASTTLTVTRSNAIGRRRLGKSRIKLAYRADPRVDCFQQTRSVRYQRMARVPPQNANAREYNMAHWYVNLPLTTYSQTDRLQERLKQECVELSREHWWRKWVSQTVCNGAQKAHLPFRRHHLVYMKFSIFYPEEPGRLTRLALHAQI